jgi:lysyl-tRNA synthetase, class I
MAEEKKIFHWTDVTAEKIIREKGNKDKYVLAAGITPSGVVHIGNFREIITVDLIRRALEKKGKKVRFIYSWDDYDVFRKVPKGMPKEELLEKHLRKSIMDTPDTYDCHDNYAQHNEAAVENDIKEVGINPEFISQSKKYQDCDYSKDMKIALENTDKIKSILNQYRENPLEDSWLPVAIFCSKCGKDTIKELKWLGEYKLSYICECGMEEEFDFREKGIAKLKWRVDWPMRWNYETVDFEPGGKDHSTVGGSFDTGKQICKDVWDFEAPTYIMYDFISVKGGAGKMSSSSGNVITLKDVLEVYEPEIARYLFAGTRPNKEFSITFDLDILTIYEDFDKSERAYFGLEKIKEKEIAKRKVAYELSCINEIPKTIPYQPSFRHLTMLLQIYDFDIDKVIRYFEKELKNEDDKERLRVRAGCAKNWIQKYAPEEFKFSVQDKCQVDLNEKEKDILSQLADKLLEKEWTDAELHEEIYVLCTNSEFPSSDFFKLAYQVLINKDKGPRLASFILEIGRERVAELLKKV